jgi:hypothetical protein
VEWHRLHGPSPRRSTTRRSPAMDLAISNIQPTAKGGFYFYFTLLAKLSSASLLPLLPLDFAVLYVHPSWLACIPAMLIQEERGRLSDAHRIYISAQLFWAAIMDDWFVPQWHCLFWSVSFAIPANNER